MGRIKSRSQQRTKRHIRLRQKVRGTGQRPRLAVFRSLRHIYAQVVDDDKGVTLAAASSLEPAIRGGESAPKGEVSEQVGELIGARAKAEGVTEIVFDRGGNQYHGRVKKLADAVRKQGLKF